jgi:AraC family transcriptional regulator
VPKPVEAGRFFGAPLRNRHVSGLQLVESLHGAGTQLPRHAHERAYFCLNLSGTYVEQFGRRRRTSVEGMLVFHPAGEAHQQAHGPGPVRSFNVEVGPEWLRQILEIAGPLDHPAEFQADATADDDRDSALGIESLAMEVLAACARPHARLADSGAPRWVREARDLIDASLSDPLSLGCLARRADVHPVHFASTFRRFYGVSVGEYVRHRRIEQARRQLVQGDRSLAEIAGNAGFTDQSHFTRAFKRYTGMAPGQYRTFLAFKT